VHGTAEHALSTWLSSAVEHSEGQTPAGPVRFFIAPTNDDTLVGTWIESRDAVQRSFPLVVSTRVPCDVEAVQWPLVLAYYGAFLREAERVLSAHVDQGVEQLDHARSTLPQPHPSEMPSLLQQARQSAANERVHAFARRNFRAEPVDALAYASSTLLSAVRLGDPELTLDMPITLDGDVFAWLELMSAALGQARKPCVVLWSLPAQRMLVGFGSASPQLLAYLSQPDHRSNRRWPLWTSRQGAAEAARSSLPSALVRALEGDVSVAEWIDSLRQGATS